MKWFKRSIILLGIVGGIGVTTVLLSGAKAARQADSKYRTGSVDQGDITQVVLANGTLQPVTSVNVGVQVSGTVSERFADFNDHVKAGQILLKLDPSAFQARLRQARAQLESAQASLTLAKANDERNRRLKDAGFLSGAAIEQTRHELGVALANIELAKAQVDAAQTDLNNSVVKSPINGVIIKRNIDVGQTIAAAFQTPDLFQIAQDLKKMQIYTNVSEADVGYVKPGQKVKFSVDAYLGREFDGVVEQFRLNPTNASGIVTYNIVISVNNEDELLKPGMTAQTRIIVATRRDVLRVPTAALRFQPDEQDSKNIDAHVKSGSSDKNKTARAGEEADDGVLSATEGINRIYRVYSITADKDGIEHMKQHDVTIGIANTRYTEILSGDLKVADKVVTRSNVATSKD